MNLCGRGMDIINAMAQWDRFLFQDRFIRQVQCAWDIKAKMFIW
jgi:hypothetical protein